MFDESCIFCKIVQKQAPSSIIYEDEAVMVFLDIRPLNMGHTLVIPKAHYVDIFDIPPKTSEPSPQGVQTDFLRRQKSHKRRWNQYHPAERQSCRTRHIPFTCACGSAV